MTFIQGSAIAGQGINEHKNFCQDGANGVKRIRSARLTAQQMVFGMEFFLCWLALCVLESVQFFVPIGFCPFVVLLLSKDSYGHTWVADLLFVFVLFFASLFTNLLLGRAGSLSLSLSVVCT